MCVSAAKADLGESLNEGHLSESIREITLFQVKSLALQFLCIPMLPVSTETRRDGGGYEFEQKGTFIIFCSSWDPFRRSLVWSYLSINNRHLSEAFKWFIASFTTTWSCYQTCVPVPDKNKYFLQKTFLSHEDHNSEFENVILSVTLMCVWQLWLCDHHNLIFNNKTEYFLWLLIRDHISFKCTFVWNPCNSQTAKSPTHLYRSIFVWNLFDPNNNWTREWGVTCFMLYTLRLDMNGMLDGIYVWLSFFYDRKFGPSFWLSEEVWIKLNWQTTGSITSG